MYYNLITFVTILSRLVHFFEVTRMSRFSNPLYILFYFLKWIIFVKTTVHVIEKFVYLKINIVQIFMYST